MANKILIKNRIANATAPTAAQATVGELALNAFDGRLYAGTNIGLTNVNPGVEGAQASWVGAPILDEDAMGSNSATKLATQQSIKAYADTMLPLAGGTMSGAIAMGTAKLTGVGDPTAAQDAATKAYVDATAQGLYIHDAVVMATTASLGYTYSNGSSGVGATFTAGSTGAVTIDGVATATTGERVLVKNEADAEENGIYQVSTASGVGVTLVLTRVTDFDVAADMKSGAFVFVQKGTANADAGFVMTQDAAITVGTTAVTWSQFSGAGQITAGTNLSKSGNTLNVDDAFLKNDASDSTTGTITAAGFTTVGTVAAEHLSSTDDLVVAGLATVGETLAVTGTLSAATASTIGNLTLGNGSITDSGGAISFGNENLSTSGTLGAGVATVTGVVTGNSGTVKFMDGDGSHYTTIAAHATTTADVAYTLPAAGPGTNGYVLASTTAGVMSWTENTGGIANDAAATITLSDSATNAVSTVLTLGHLSDATNAIGGGVGIDFNQETTDGVSEIGMQLEAVIADETAGTEDFDFSVKLMANGGAAAEKFKVSSIGDITFDGKLDGGSF